MHSEYLPDPAESNMDLRRLQYLLVEMADVCVIPARLANRASVVLQDWAAELF